MDEVWSEQDTSPGHIEAALREMIGRRGEDDERTFVPARVMNLVAIVDAEFRGEIENRLRRVGRYHPSRLVVCAVEHGRETIDAVVTVSADIDPKPGELVPTVERVVLDIGLVQGVDQHDLREPSQRVDGLLVPVRRPHHRREV